MKNLRFVHYGDSGAPTTIRSFTAQEEKNLIDELLESMGGDRLSDLLYELAQLATVGQADSIEWD